MTAALGRSLVDRIKYGLTKMRKTGLLGGDRSATQKLEKNEEDIQEVKHLKVMGIVKARKLIQTSNDIYHGMAKIISGHCVVEWNDLAMSCCVK